MNFGSGSAKWRDTGAHVASPHLRGKKVVALAATVSVGASLFGLTTLATTPAGAAPVTTSWNDRCVPHPSTSSASPKNQANSITVDAPATVTQGNNFTVTYTFPVDWYPDKESGATVGPLARLKRDFRLPDGTAYVSGAVTGTSSGLSGVTPNVLQVDDSGNPSSTGNVIRLSGDNYTVGNGPKSATNNLNGIQVPRGTISKADSHSGGDHYHYQLPAITLTLTATGTAGNTINHTLRNTGNAALIDKAENPGTALAKASLIITVWTYTHCVPQTSPGSGVPGGAGLGTLATTSITAPVQNTTTSLSVPPTATVGQSVNLSATVTAGVGTPTGTVQFKDGVSNIGSPVTLSGGSATLPHTFTSVGSHSITAEYSGASGFNPSTSAASAVNVGKASPTTSVSAPPTANLNQSVTLSASVTGSSPTGTVQFKDGGVDIGTPVALSAGSASMSWSFGSAGNHSITAVYSGDANNNGSTSSASTVNVSASNSTTSLTAPATATVGASVSLSASVSGYGTPTGTVQFKENGNNIGSPVTLSGGSASTTWTPGTAGSRSITAVYSGDTNNNGSTSSASTVNVSVATYAMTGQVTDVNSNPLAGMTVQLRTGSGPNGVVDTTTSDGSGTYSFTVEAGSYRVYAFEPGDQNYAGQWYGNVAQRPDATVVNVASTVSGIDIALLPATQIIRGTVRNDTGTPLEGISVRLRDNAGNSVFLLSTRANGRYNFGALPAGDYTVFASDASNAYVGTWYGDAQQRNGAVVISLPAQAQTDIDINMVPASRGISGTVTLEGGGAAVGVVVDLRDATGVNRVALATTDGNGSYSFSGIDKGMYKLYFRGVAGYDGVWFGGSQQRASSSTIIVSNDGMITGIDGQLLVAQP